MKVGLVQLNSTNDLKINLESMIQIMIKSQLHLPEILIFPENSLYFRISSDEKIVAVDFNGPEIEALKNKCFEQKIAIHFTTAIVDKGAVYNASVLIEKNRNVTLLYRKMHLFDIELKGQRPIRESDVFIHGAAPNIFEFCGFKFGSSICYDIRFSELYSYYAKKEVDVLLAPSAFLVKTGLAHWEVLLRARAIESQCYLLAPAQGGVHKSAHNDDVRETYGHSLIIDPWGTVLAQLGEGTGVIYSELNRDEITKVRSQIPMAFHRRNVL